MYTTWSFIFFLLLLSQESRSQRAHPCDQGSCYPATGNLLIGRESRLTASSTCGLYYKERFCIVSHLEDRKKCFWCDSSSEKSKFSHKIANIVTRTKPGTRKATWWQSANGVENVSIRLDLEAEFHFTHLIITFKTFRPAAMLIERSYNFGTTWKVYRYFASNCAESFPGIPTHSPTKITDIICESQYSDVAPSTEGEVIFRVLPPNLPVDDPYSNEVQDLLKVTNLRINLTRLHTLGDDLLDNRQEIKEKYYYAIYNMVVRGSCSCYGHASRCLPLSDEVNHRPDMVYGRCECTHNTKGFNCEECKNFYNDLPWRPAIGRQTNECQKCNCNNHAENCHFDPAVYEATGRVSGGVCDNCQHNTMGRNCEQCKSFFYRNRDLPLDHILVCSPCDCDPRGSLGDGICDPIDDHSNNLVAGQCHCKRNVGGTRCDSCLPFFYNFDENNPDGCQPCTCNPLGTDQGQGCNPWTGKCICKPYVTGQDCSQCLPEHYGLSSDKDGCKSCNCDLGGAYDNNCDVVTGQCKCRRHVTGRSCDTPSQGYFAGSLDYLVYEAELARSSPDSQLVIREPFHDGREATWTGLGFQRVHPGSWLEFDIDEIFQNLNYDLVLRYNPTRGASFPNTKITLQRKHTPSGRCAHSDDSPRQVDLHSDNYYEVANPSVCLEEGHKYKIRVDFREYKQKDDGHTPTPQASILIDSLVLVPRLEDTPVFPAAELRQREEFDQYHCSELYFGVPILYPLPEACRKYLHSIGFYVYGEGKDCACDPTGSLSSICDSLGGQCPCKPYVAGRRCDRCDAGTYGFGPQGCFPCECNPVGSLDNLCDSQTGQCRCRPNRNTYGRQCDQCQPGFWDFPACKRCECNAHADSCESHTGICIGCRDATDGHHCEVCLEGYYGDPRLSIDISCRPCPCPGTVSYGHSFASRCVLDPLTQGVTCECNLGYAGERCQYCADNYYGHPEEPNGSCQMCFCNGNIDLSAQGNCDPYTGECLRCLYHTEGSYCDRCQNGYYGNPINQTCRECYCDYLGSDLENNSCDKTTGQCPCRPNVVGMHCDVCKPNHWKIASGSGCEFCDCDPVGSQSESCNEYDGQCDCYPGFGGRKCDQCLADHWGDPHVECFPCQCNAEGSATKQCDRSTGHCLCIPGIGGAKCDQCAYGFEGEALQCEKCPECFWNWNRLLDELKERSKALVEKATFVQQVGVTGAYTEHFSALEKKLAEINSVIDNATISEKDFNSSLEEINSMNNDLNDVAAEISQIENDLASLVERSYLSSLAIGDFKNRANELRGFARQLENEGAQLQEANVEGALNLTREAWRRSENAQKRIDMVYKVLGDSVTQRNRAKTILDRQRSEMEDAQESTHTLITDVGDRLNKIEAEIPDINQLICDKRGNPCDEVCGGAGCGKCGGRSCNEGAITKAEYALIMATEAHKLLDEQKAALNSSLHSINRAKLDAETAERSSIEAINIATSVHNGTRALLDRFQETNKRTDDFLWEQRASPAEVRRVAEEVLGMSVSLDEDQISKLASEIQEATEVINNIDQILLDTENDHTETNDLKARSELARDRAEQVLKTAQNVLMTLDEAKNAQEAARKAAEVAGENVQDAHNFLSEISRITTEGYKLSNESSQKLHDLNDQVQQLRRLNTKIENDLRDASTIVELAEQMARSSQQDADKLKTMHETLTMALNGRVLESDSLHERSSRVKERANHLSATITSKVLELEDMENEYMIQEQKFDYLASEISHLNNAMDGHLMHIGSKVEFYRTCT